MSEMKQYWDDVFDQCETAHLVAWDGCHKIYLAMDETQDNYFRVYYGNPGRDIIGDGPDERFAFFGEPEEMFNKVKEWWGMSCGLRFISAVYTNASLNEANYVQLIPQFSDEEVDA